MDPLANPVVVVFAAVVPLLVSIFKQSGFSETQNRFIALGVYAAVGVVGALAVSGTPDPATIVTWIASVTLIGRVAYDMFWKSLGGAGEDSIEARLTAATSVIRG